MDISRFRAVTKEAMTRGVQLLQSLDSGLSQKIKKLQKRGSSGVELKVHAPRNFLILLFNGKNGGFLNVTLFLFL